MKKFINIICCIAAALLMTACDKVDKNGDLDGMWQSCDYQEVTDTYYIPYLSVQLDLLSIRYQDMVIYARFEHSGSTLKIYNVYSSLNTVDTPMSEANDNGNENQIQASHCLQFLEEYFKTDDLGEATFTIQELTGSKLVLTKDGTTLNFRKY